MAGQNMEEIMEKLRQGTPLYKVKSPYKMLERNFHLDISNMYFYYDGSEKRNKDTRVPIYNIIAVKKGEEDYDSKMLAGIERHLCLVLYLISPTRTMHLKARDESTRDIWIQGIQYVLEQKMGTQRDVGNVAYAMGASNKPDFGKKSISSDVVAIPSRGQTKHQVMEDCYSRSNEHPTDLDLLLLGKTGNGKSAAGNAILARKLFLKSANTTSETQDLAWGVGKYKRKKIKVVDGPGVGDTKLDPKERVTQMQNWLNKAIMMNDRGYHAFLLVLKYGNRFTDEEGWVIQFLKSMFGDNFVADHCIVLMTCGDNFEADSADDGKTFDQWCNEQEGSFRNLVTECKHRIVLFNSRATGGASDAQRKELVRVVESLGDKRYTNELFENASKSREKIQVEAEKPRLEMDVMEKMDLINLEINDVFQLSQMGNYDHKHRLETLSQDCEELIRSLEKNDRGTGILNNLLAKVKNQKRSIESMNAVLSKEKQDKDELKVALDKLVKVTDEVQNQINVEKVETGAWDVLVNGVSSVASGVGKVLISPFAGASEYLMKSAISVQKYASDTFSN